MVWQMRQVLNTNITRFKDRPNKNLTTEDEYKYLDIYTDTIREHQHMIESYVSIEEGGG